MHAWLSLPWVPERDGALILAYDTPARFRAYVGVCFFFGLLSLRNIAFFKVLGNRVTISQTRLPSQPLPNERLGERARK